MTTTITNYTTYDLAYYYADLRRIPFLTAEEQSRLMAATPPAAPRLDIQTRNRLIEDHLSLAKRIAIDTCPPTAYHKLPDIIGEVNLALVRAGNNYDVQAGGNLHSYFIVYAEKAVKRALAAQKLIRVPSSLITRARAEDRLHEVYALQPLSLDQVMQHFEDEEDEYDEPLAAPILPTQAAPARNPALRAQVDAYLALLSPRAQAVLRLRYGLGDDNEHAHAPIEIAQALGLSTGLVKLAERDALARLKALAAGEARIVTRKGKPCISYPAAHKPPVLSPAQESAFVQAATRLSEQGMSVTREHLAQETGMGIGRAQVFLRAHRDELVVQAKRQKRAPDEQQQHAHHERLEQAYTQLTAQGPRMNYRLLAKSAQVNKQSAMEFLRARRGQGDPRAAYRAAGTSKESRAQERLARLEEACQHLEAQGERVSIERVARIAHVNKKSTAVFFQARKERQDAAN
jgi:RNA polymerase sigma factor (sigma-70 family)